MLYGSRNVLWVTRLIIGGESTHFMNWACLLEEYGIVVYHIQMMIFGSGIIAILLVDIEVLHTRTVILNYGFIIRPINHQLFCY